MVINGRKWWSTGVGHPDCKIFVFMGLTDPEADRHSRHTMVLVPRDTPGVKVERMLSVMGMHDEPHGHGEVSFDDVRVPLSTSCSAPGEAFEIAQGRLGPGRVHHCMRLVGLAETEALCRRWMMVASKLLAAIAILGLAFAHNAVAIGFLLCLAGAASAALSLNLYAIAQMFAGPRASGTWVGFQNAIGNLSGSSGRSSPASSSSARATTARSS